MAKIPDDIKSAMKQLSEHTKVPSKDLLAQMKELLKTDETILAMGDEEEKKEFKIRYAWALIYRQYSMTGNAVDYVVRVVNVPRPRQIKVKGEPTYVGELIAIARKVNRNESGDEELGEPTYAAGTFWRDGAKNLEKLEKGKVYRSKLIETEYCWGVGITSDRATFTESKDDIPKFDDFYKSEIEPNLKSYLVTIGSMDIHASETTTDLRIIEATVIGAEVGVGSNNKEYGRYDIMDSSVVGGSYTIFVSPEEVEWAKGSILRFGGTVQHNQDTGDTRWTHHFIKPTKYAMPKSIVVKAVGKEEVDIDLDDEEDEEPVKKPAKKSANKKEETESAEEEDDFEI